MLEPTENSLGSVFHNKNWKEWKLTDSKSHAEGDVTDGVDSSIDGRVPNVNQVTELWKIQKDCWEMRGEEGTTSI